VAPSTLNAWAIEPILACAPLYEAFKTDVLGRPVIFTDDTPVDMLQEGLGRTKETRMWVYVGGCGPPYRFFDFTEDRRKERPGQILAKYAGFVHADAYSGYDHLFKNSARIIEVGCWCHARRKWDEALDSARGPCTEMLLRIRELYKVESRIKGEEPQSRLAVRQAESVPLLDKFYERLEEISAERVVLPSSLIAKSFGNRQQLRRERHPPARARTEELPLRGQSPRRQGMCNRAHSPAKCQGCRPQPLRIFARHLQPHHEPSGQPPARAPASRLEDVPPMTPAPASGRIIVADGLSPTGFTGCLPATEGPRRSMPTIPLASQAWKRLVVIP